MKVTSVDTRVRPRWKLRALALAIGWAILGSGCSEPPPPDWREVRVVRYNPKEPGLSGVFSHTIIEETDGKRYMIRGRWGDPGDVARINFSNRSLFMSR